MAPKTVLMRRLGRPSLVIAAMLAVTVLSAAPGGADPPAADPYDAPRAVFAGAAAELRAHYLDVQRRSGDADGLQGRVDGDAGAIAQPVTPPGWTQAEYVDAYAHIAGLDASLVDQLATGKFHDLKLVRGLDDVLVKSPADGTLQPVSVFVPTGYDPAKPTSLVIFLHGRGWSEATSLGVPFIRDLAQQTGTIVAAPYARGDIGYADPAPADIYATVDAMESAFNVDRSRVYLAGWSMGGFGVFQVAPLHPDVWAALMCVSGALTNEDRNDVVRQFRSKTIYVVSGVKDDVVPHRYSQISVQWLRESKVATRFYAEPEGSHSMATFRPSLRAGWKDMLAGVRGDSGSVNVDLSGPPPAPTIQTRPMPP